MEVADRIGIVLEGQVQAQKTFPNGSMINVSIRFPGDLIGPAAVFSRNHHYPCDVSTVEPATIMMLRKDDLLALMQKDLRILENFTTEISTATYMLRQRLELFSYTGIAQKVCFLAPASLSTKQQSYYSYTRKCNQVGIADECIPPITSSRAWENGEKRIYSLFLKTD